MEDEYKVVCALSNSAAFDDLVWPRTPVSRSQYSLKANISQTVHPIHSMFGSRLGFSGSADRMTLFAVGNFQNGSWWPSWNDGAVARERPLHELGFLVDLVATMDKDRARLYTCVADEQKHTNIQQQVQQFSLKYTKCGIYFKPYPISSKNK